MSSTASFYDQSTADFQQKRFSISTSTFCDQTAAVSQHKPTPRDSSSDQSSTADSDYSRAPSKPSCAASFSDQSTVAPSSAAVSFEDFSLVDLEQKDPAFVHSQLVKTRLCRYHMTRRCLHGEKCKFAHGVEDLREDPDFTRTKLCPQMGNCDNKDCRFAHSVLELRATAGQNDNASVTRNQGSDFRPPPGLSLQNDDAGPCMRPPPGVFLKTPPGSFVSNKGDVDFSIMQQTAQRVAGPPGSFISNNGDMDLGMMQQTNQKVAGHTRMHLDLSKHVDPQVPCPGLPAQHPLKNASANGMQDARQQMLGPPPQREQVPAPSQPMQKLRQKLNRIVAEFCQEQQQSNEHAEGAAYPANTEKRKSASRASPGQGLIGSKIANVETCPERAEDFFFSPYF